MTPLLRRWFYQTMIRAFYQLKCAAPWHTPYARKLHILLFYIPQAVWRMPYGLVKQGSIGFRWLMHRLDLLKCEWELQFYALILYTLLVVICPAETWGNLKLASGRKLPLRFGLKLAR